MAGSALQKSTSGGLRANRRRDGSAPRSFPRLKMRHAVLEEACDSSATDISILQDTTRLKGRQHKSKATCFFVLIVPAHTLLCVEKFAHSLQETEVVKEADEHVRFAVPQAVPPPVYRTACHGHVSLYVTANTGKPAGREK